ncbi:dihydroorotate dehydrogenase [Pyrofollis japonicus]|uniref:dihydroorotate dehydrogenase PyrD n=1 Tax=Pyrofollis japonicus TaxID=3060460 RepID=UPI00295B5A57|nr:dihydroorotate dehydrogenase PyrD [Pyrofollis japonicus]BEP17235.1 dihydroorotate dehydrogenase [Pyrofollis japonicus]
MESPLAVSVAGLRLQHPVMNASGILGSSREGFARLASAGVAAIVTKSFTRESRRGYPTPIAVPLEYGLLNAVGLSNPGAEALPGLVAEAKKHGVPVVVSIAGGGVDEFVEVAGIAEEAGADAVELNLSCPHAEGRGLELGMDPAMVRRIVGAVSSTVRVPVLAKLGLSDRILESAGAALEAGARGLVLINTIRAMRIDVWAKTPILGNIVGGLSGPAIHPIAVRVVYEVYAEHGADIVGVGGVYDWETAVELILAGARAVQVGTAIIAKGEQVISEIVDGLRRYLKVIGAQGISEIVGAAHRR